MKCQSQHYVHRDDSLEKNASSFLARPWLEWCSLWTVSFFLLHKTITLSNESHSPACYEDRRTKKELKSRIDFWLFVELISTRKFYEHFFEYELIFFSGSGDDEAKAQNILMVSSVATDSNICLA